MTDHSPKFAVGQRARFQDFSDEDSAEFRGVGYINQVEVDPNGLHEYRLSNRQYDDGHFQPYSAWYAEDELSPAVEEPNP